MREVVHARADFLGAFHRFGSSASVMAVRRPRSTVFSSIVSTGQLLTDVVVQLARDPGTLLFLRLSSLQPRSRIRS